MKPFSITKISAIALLVIAGSCTNLDEKRYLYDTVDSEDFYKTDAELVSAVGAAYTNLFSYAGNATVLPLAEVTTDEMIVPTRGADWGDGGVWVELQKHTYGPTNARVNDCWNFLYGGVNTCNRLLAKFESLGTDQAKSYVSELKVLRAIYYLMLLDTYGNIPLSIDFTATTPPAATPRAEVYAFVEKELTDNVSLLKKTGPTDDAFYGRVTYYVGYAALAKLYINAGVYKGTPEWDKAIDACDTIINSGLYKLTPNYSDNFIKDNKESPEFIWAVPYDELKAGGFNMPMMTLSYLNQATYNINEQPWNGFATQAEFYNSYIDPTQNPGPQGKVVGLNPKGDSVTGTLDKRMSNFLVGPQYASDGSRLVDGGADVTDPDGQPLTFTPYINEIAPNAWRQSGARIGKWQFYKPMTRNLSNDFGVYRYADILLLRAEALARKTGNWSDPYVLGVINQIRARANVDPFVTLTADKFYGERSREMFAECFHRQDMIRFGKYNSAWGFHPADPADNLGPGGINHLNVFPIPETQINANQNLTQNPGY